MNFLLEGLREGFLLALRGDPEVMSASWVTIKVALGATFFGGLFGMPIGWCLASKKFRGRGAAIAILQSLLGIPTVVIGLVVYGILSRRGPLGFADLADRTILEVISHPQIGAWAARITGAQMGNGGMVGFLAKLFSGRSEPKPEDVLAEQLIDFIDGNGRVFISFAVVDRGDRNVECG